MGQKSILIISFLVVAYFFVCQELPAQIRTGGAFLKFLPGAKQQVSGPALVSDIDNLYGFWGNPGLIGMGRESGWSAAYSDWLSDFTATSIFAGKRFRIGNLRQQKLVLSFSNIFLPEFDSTKDRMPVVQAGDFIASAGYGLTLPGFADRFALGVHAKYFRSELDRFQASTLAFDFGVIYKSLLRAALHSKIPFLKSWRFAAGASVQNLGRPIKYVREETPLPRTVRLGSSLYLGSHSGTQMRFGLGYRAIQDEDDHASLSYELNLGRVFSVYVGYVLNLKNRGLLNNYSFGISLGLDDKFGVLKNKLLGRNFSGQFEMSGFESSDKQNIGHFANTLHVSASHLFVGPEPFRLQYPQFAAEIYHNSVELNWQQSLDRDIFDNVKYWLLVDDDSTKLIRILKNIRVEYGKEYSKKRQFIDQKLLSTGGNRPLHSLAVSDRYAKIKALRAGTYFWTTIAYDSDHHYRIADVNGGHISKFIIRLPDLEIEKLTVACGEEPAAELVIINNGQAPAERVIITIVDLMVSRGMEVLSSKSPVENNLGGNLILQDTLAFLGVGERFQRRILLDATRGDYHLIARVDASDLILENDEDNNEMRADSSCFTNVSIEKIELSGLKPSKFGGDLKYRLTIANKGFAPAKNIQVADTLSPLVKWKSFDNFSGKVNGDILNWRIAELPAGEIKTIEYTVNLTDPFANTEFDVAKHFLRPNSKMNLQKEHKRILKIFAARIAYNPYKAVEIQGHTDSDDTEPRNQALSQRRANSVLKYLLQLGDASGKLNKWVDSNSVIARGYGEMRPIASNATKAGKQANRRVSLGDNFILDIINRSEIVLEKDKNAADNRAEFVIDVATDLIVKFDLNQSSFSRKTESALDSFLDRYLPKLYADSARIILISGHTDSLGSDGHNRDLSLKRARFVLAYFAEKGVAEERMQAVGYSSKFPVATNATDEGRKQNRRVAVEIVKRGTVN